MSWQEVDFLFPFVVFAYGFLISISLGHPWAHETIKKRAPDILFKMMESHRKLAFACLWVGSLWSLQNLWL
ncbi:MAG: hypothetical protein COT74_05845 [Bdellovibrionales bacterium CG10_big_fil_rev_8_21_14_0_10_45_34]|nr:MAG: hypothetical protein COT74_05845 [Bdellovibrionales bacterium CG10_big_fil_rev_8_21_14_0_10_45_34]